jgi:hypothetical protein
VKARDDERRRTDTMPRRGSTSWSFLSTAAVKAVNLKAEGGVIDSLEFFNVGAAPVYVRLYDTVTAPTTADGASIIWRGVVPGSSSGAGVVVRWPKGLGFDNGLGIRVTGGGGETDATALNAGEVRGNVAYS